MNKDIRISVVTVVLDDAEGLSQTAESIARQDYDNIEWVVKDGGSSSDLIEMAAGIVGDKVIFKGMSGPDKSIYDAMNIGVSHCTGEYCVFVNAGDTLANSETLSLVVSKIVDSLDGVEPDVIYAGAYLEFENGSSVYRGPRIAADTLWHGLPANHQATYFKRDRLKDVPYDLSYRVCGDYYLVASLERAGVTSVYLDVPVINFMIGGYSFSNPLKLHLEPAKIQRRVLGSSFLSIGLSMLRRFAATVSLAVLVMLRRDQAGSSTK